MKSQDTFREILALLGRLDGARIAYALRQCREDALMVEVDVPGEHWQIEFVDDGDEVHVEIERFRSNGKIEGKKLLEDLFAKDSDEETPRNTNGKTAR